MDNVDFSALFKHYFKQSEILLKPTLKSILFIKSLARKHYLIFHKMINFPQSHLHLNTIKIWSSTPVCLECADYTSNEWCLFINTNIFHFNATFCWRYQAHILRPVLQIRSKCKKGLHELVCDRKQKPCKPKALNQTTQKQGTDHFMHCPLV